MIRVDFQGNNDCLNVFHLEFYIKVQPKFDDSQFKFKLQEIVNKKKQE